MAKGYVEPLKSGSFRAVVYGGKDPITGKKVYLKETHPSEGEANKAKERLLAQVEAERVPDKAATLAYLLDRWMEVADHELSTTETNEGYIRRTLKPALGDMPLRKLQHRVDILDRLYTHLRRCNLLCDGRPFIVHTSDGPHDCATVGCKPHQCKPMSPGSVRRIHAILSAALNYAVGWGWIERNPTEYAHPPKLPKRRAQPPEPDQVARLINLAWQEDSEFALFLWLAVTTGARRGELAALRWSDCNLERGELLVDENYVVRKRQRRLKDTKTEEDRRLSLDTLSVELLEDFHAARTETLRPAGIALTSEAFVFSPDPACLRPWHPDHFTHTYREFADRVGIITPLKNLRHFNATQLLASGVDLRTTAGRLGHSDGGATTLRVYASWVRPADQRAVEMLAQDLQQLREKAALTSSGSSNGQQAPTGLSASFSRGIVAKSIDSILLRPAGPLDESERSPYEQIAAELRAAIDTGKLEAGDVLPTVTELAQWYGIARGTAQRAVKLLADDGRVILRRGARSVVATR